MAKKHGIALQKQLKVDKSTCDTYQMGRSGKRLVGGVISPVSDSSAPRFVQKSADLMNSRMGAPPPPPPPYPSVGTGSYNWGKITRWVYTATHAGLFVKLTPTSPGTTG